MASQIRESPHAVGLPFDSSSAVMEDLLTTPGSYTFVQAVHLASRHVRQQTLPVAHNYCRFSVNPSLAFPPADIESLSILSSEDGPPRIDMMLNLLGLHGADSPLPAYFTEHVAQHSDDPEPDPLQDFFNIFNHRIILVLHAIWGKYRYYARYARNAEDAFSQKFYGFIGVGPRESRTTRNIQWPRLMAYMGLIAMSGDAAGSLESILRHYFNHSDITIIPCIPRWVLIPPDQQTVLGIQNCILGETFILGDEIRDQSGKFRICIDNLDWQTFISFLPCYAKFEELKAVVNFALRSRLSFDVELKLKPGEIRPWILGDDTHSTLLGWSIWNTTQTEGIVVLETDFGEL